MDKTSLTTLLRVNGLTPESPEADIRMFLAKAGYSNDEINAGVAMLQGQPLPTAMPSAVSPGVASTPAPAVPQAMGITQPVSVVSSPKPSRYKGRIGVGQYWWSTIMLFFVSVALSLAIGVVALGVLSISGGGLDGLMRGGILFIFLGGGIILLAVPIGLFVLLSLGLQIRRYHDYGLSGWMVVVVGVITSVVRYFAQLHHSLYPFAMTGLFLAGIVLMSWPGTKGSNKYGDPTTYPSTWGALLGRTDGSGTFKRFFMHALLPTFVVAEAVALVVIFIIQAHGALTLSP